MLPAGMITFELFVAHMDILLMQNSVVLNLISFLIAEAMGHPRVVPFLLALQIFKQCSTLLASFHVQVDPYSQT
jgi:hypothetical protein